MGTGARRTPKSNQEGPREIRRVMSEVIRCGPWWNPSGAVNLGTFPYCVKSKCSLWCRENSVQGAIVTQSSQKAPLNPGNSTALLMERRAHNYSGHIRLPTNSKCAKSSDIKGARTRGVPKEVARQSPGTVIKKQNRDSMSRWSGYNDPIPYHAKMADKGEERMERE